MTKIPVRAHRRKKPGGGTTSVREHTRHLKQKRTARRERPDTTSLRLPPPLREADFPDLDDDAEEGHLLMMNEYEVYSQYRVWKENYRKKVGNGTYDRSLAVKGIEDNFVPWALRTLREEHRHLPRTFTRQQKHDIAVYVVSDIEDEIRYDSVR